MWAKAAQTVMSAQAGMMASVRRACRNRVTLFHYSLRGHSFHPVSSYLLPHSEKVLTFLRAPTDHELLVSTSVNQLGIL